jgi:hypothetical protein
MKTFASNRLFVACRHFVIIVLSVAAVVWISGPGAVLQAAVPSHEGSGKLADVTFIQRIHTSGGKPPVVGEAKQGDEIRVPYSADYVFYGSGAKTRATIR